jgi:amino acid adenylation domain-containing protein/thioester reductase-like protein
MQKEEGLSTKLWLEERENLLKDLSDPTLPQTYKFTLNKPQLGKVNKFLKENGYIWNVLVHAAWGLLLNRISTTETVCFGSTDVQIKSKIPRLSRHPKPVHSRITDQTICKQFLDAFKKQVSSKGGKTNTETNDIRYLCLKEHGVDSNSKLSQILNVSQFTLSIVYHEKDYGKFTFIYHAGYFRKHNLKRLSQYFISLLLGICRELNDKIIDIEMMSASEKKTILKKWAEPDYSFETIAEDKCSHELIVDIAAKNPSLLAISHNGDSISFADLNRQSDMLARVLIERGIKPHDKVAVLMDRTPSLIIAMLAIFKSGAIFVPINTKYPVDRIEFVIEDSQASCVLVNNASKIPGQSLIKILSLPQDWLMLPEPSTSPVLPKVELSDIAYIIYTSGTTGKPKGVKIRHSSLTNLTAWYKNCFEIDERDRASQFASQGFDSYLCETVPILALGASIHIVDDNIKLSPSLFFDWLRDKKISILDLPTAYAQMLFTLDWPASPDLRLLKIGGETCMRYPAKAYSFDIWNCYGPTETTIEATYFKMYHANEILSNTAKHQTPSIGKIISNGEAYVVDKYFQPVPAGVAGELLIGGAGLSPGYLNREELTTTKFIANIFKPGSNLKLYRTGDLASWLPDGNLEFIGRTDNQVKISGYRIELGAIESVISKCPDVREVAVIAKETPNGDKTIIAYIAPNLDRERFLYQERCLLSIDDTHFMETITEDISRYGIALSGVADKIPIATKVKLHLKLPGFNASKDINARVIWQIDQRCGLVFDLSDAEQTVIAKSIDYFLSSHNIMDMVLSTAAKRSIRKALKKKLPEYMVPSTFVTLLEFPLTFSGKVDLKALPPPSEYEQALRKHYVAPTTETEKKMTALWELLLGRTNIGMEDNFFDLGGNSIKAAGLSVKIMNEFNISMPANILFDLPYIPILAEYIDTNGARYSTDTLIQEDIDRDKILHENIQPTGKLSTKINNPENILLTGAGGFLGVFMLNDLLISTNAKIHCLVRKGEFESAARRLGATIKKFNLSDNISLSNRRIIAIPSDLSLDKFGIPLEQYNNLAEKVDLIYHCGAQVNIMASYNSMRGSNVQGTQEVIKFATSMQDKPIHYISTLSSAYLKDANDALVEEFPTEQYHDLFGGYAISKWVSERLLTELKDRGLPVTIYRSGYISGHSTTGMTSLNDALLMLIKGCIELGFAPDLKEKITILPVDFVSKAIVKLSLAAAGHSSVFHLDHPVGMMWTDLVAWLNDYGYELKIIPMADWKLMLQGITQRNTLYPFLPYYLALPNDYHSADVRIDRAAAALKQVGLVYTEINDQLLSLYFDYLCLEGFLAKPAKRKTTV